MAKTIAITGANGFIGTALVALLHNNGYRVKALVHHFPARRLEGVVYYEYDLLGSLNIELFVDVDVLIHLAFHFKKPNNQESDINLSAAFALKSLNLNKYIFISSFSASADARSYYGKCKYQLEQIFYEDTIIRPGLVLGDGGLFLKLKTQIEKNPFVPILAGGKQPMQTIYLQDLLVAIKILAENKENGIYHLANNISVNYKGLMLLIAKSVKKKIYFISIPVGMIRLIISISHWMKQPIITQDNLDGLLQAVYIPTSNDLQKLNLSLLNTEEALEELIFRQYALL